LIPFLGFNFVYNKRILNKIKVLFYSKVKVEESVGLSQNVGERREGRVVVLELEAN
jgi:hypothetical protein